MSPSVLGNHSAHQYGSRLGISSLSAHPSLPPSPVCMTGDLSRTSFDPQTMSVCPPHIPFEQLAEAGSI